MSSTGVRFSGISQPQKRAIPGPELAERCKILSRLFSAWPNSRPASVDATLCEYLEATRGISYESGELERLVNLVIADASEFLPPAGAILRRAAELVAARQKRSYSPSASVADRIEADTEKLLRRIEAKTEAVETIDLDDVRYVLAGHPGGQGPLKLGAGW